MDGRNSHPVILEGGGADMSSKVLQFGGTSADMEDPFVSNPSEVEASHRERESHRYSSFDTQLFSLNTSSPSHVKRALEAHLAETEKRLHETSKLGTALVNQQKELYDKLKEVEQRQDDGEIGPDLRRRLADLEKEYNEIGREAARASLGPKSRLTAMLEDGVHGTPTLEGRSPASPAVFASQATHSPSKVSVPSRKQRNQPSSRVRDIEFATEISTSLLAQVRQLQALLAERDESLKVVNLEKSRLEVEAEGFAQRLRALDESEQRYKDENWSLETQNHDLMAAAKEAATRETRLTTALNSMSTEKSNVQRELEELKQSNGKLMEDHTIAQKAHDSELHVLRRNLNLSDLDRISLQKKVEELTGQNQELAKAVASRVRHQPQEEPRDLFPEEEPSVMGESTPENSPPPSPSKATPRHGHLESETLKSSLHHAHRMIQNLKNNIHREKTEKIELKRMLQEARDELEQRRVDPIGTINSNKRQKTKQDVFKKPPRPDMLGVGRRTVTDIEMEEPDWEDQAEASPTRLPSSRPRSALIESVDGSDAYQTANETEESFETATERDVATESEAFQTGAESLAGDSNGDLTETESRTTAQSTLRHRKSSKLALARAGDRSSFISTASTSADENDTQEMHTPIQAQPQRYRLRFGRSRRGRPSSETPMAPESGQLSAQNSPASVDNPQGKTFAASQSLFAELGDLGGGTASDGEFGTPLRSRTASLASNSGHTVTAGRTPPVDSAQACRVTMVDSAMMTDPWEVHGYSDQAPRTVGVGNGAADLIDSAAQYTPLKSPVVIANVAPPSLDTPPKTIWDQAIYTESPSVERDEPASPTAIFEPAIRLEISPVAAEETAPIDSAPLKPTTIKQHVSPIFFAATQPVLPVALDSSSVGNEQRKLSLSSINAIETEPTPTVVSPQPVPLISGQSSSHGQEKIELAISSIKTASTAPVAPVIPSNDALTPYYLGFSPLRVEDSIPVKPSVTSENLPPPNKHHGNQVNGHFGVAHERSATAIQEDQNHDEDRSDLDPDATSQRSSKSLDANNASSDPEEDDTLTALPALPAITRSETSVQTTLTSSEIEQLLKARAAIRTVPSSEHKQSQTVWEKSSSSPAATPKAKLYPAVNAAGSQTKDLPQPALFSPTKRPGSAGSHRRSANFHPPLPLGHKEMIAAASQRMSTDASIGSMGPPLLPASAYRVNAQPLPRTPTDPTSLKSPSTPRTAVRRGSEVSHLSRRSSVTSFASELDERFNMAQSGYGFDSGVDPRMVQAVTQTMIGEFLWKYTRKPGRSDLSNTRHRRYFWVHPYTRTLYWSTRDPQTAGKVPLKTKSVAIEAVRISTDDNPYPPGLHRKSLEIITPGRTIKFTAATSQRHETWFNALSYILIRTSSDNTEDKENNITAEDANEFNPSFRSSSRLTGSRVSITSQQSGQNRAGQRQLPPFAPSLPSPTLSSRAGSVLPAEQAQVRPGSISRLSTMLRSSSMLGTFASRRSRYGQTNGSMDSTSAAGYDSAEDLKRTIEMQEREARDRVENVRACCDGKHDVGSLSRTARHSSKASHSGHNHA